MKNPSSDLHELVHSLTKSEKRYLKIQFGNQSRDYHELLDALLAQPVYDEKELKVAYAGAPFLRHLAVSKQYLYDLILKTLDRIDSEHLEAATYKQLAYARQLIRRNLAHQAIRQLRKARRTIVAHELYPAWLDLLSLEKQLLSTQSISNAWKVDNRTRIYEEERECLARMQNTNDYWWLNTQLYQLQLQFQKARDASQREQLNTLIREPLLQDVARATTFRSRVYFYQARATYHFTMGEPEAAYQYNHQFLELLESDPVHLQRNPDLYLGTLNNFLIDSLLLKKTDALRAGLEKLRAIPSRSAFSKLKRIEARVFRQSYLLEINWALAERDFDRGRQLIPSLREGLDRFGRQMDKAHRVTFHYLIAYLYFCASDGSEALNWINLLLRDRKEGVVPEIYAFNRWLNVLVHFDLGNYELLQSLLPSTRRYLRKKRPLYRTEQQLFRFLQRAMNAVNTAAFREHCLELLESLQSLRQDQREQRVFNYIDLQYWLERKINPSP